MSIQQTNSKGCHSFEVNLLDLNLEGIRYINPATKLVITAKFEESATRKVSFPNKQILKAGQIVIPTLLRMWVDFCSAQAVTLLYGIKQSLEAGSQLSNLPSQS